MLPQKALELIDEARKALRYSRPVYSGLRVGAAVLGGSGKVYRGCNFENPSLMMSLCAEKLAILKALSEGDDIVAIAIVSERSGQKDQEVSGNYCLPCGSCRQFIFEFAREAVIYSEGKDGIKKYSIYELLPAPFRP